MPNCSIVIPVWNQTDATIKCLKSIITHTEYPHEIIIIDNASKQENISLLETFLSKHAKNNAVQVIKNQTNEGFIKAVNKGIKQSKSDFICVMNNDTLATQGWLSELVNILSNNSDIAVLNPSSNNLGQKPNTDESIDDYAVGFKEDKGKFVESPLCVGFCMLFKKALIDEIGLFDESYGMGNFEDSDFSMKARQKGHTCARSLGSYVYHDENSSFRFLNSYKHEFNKNKRLFESRWGKKKRCLFALKKASSVNLFNKTVKNSSFDGAFIYVISSFEFPYEKSDRKDIYLINYKSFFNLSIFLKILFRKKRYSVVYYDNDNLKSLLTVLKAVRRIDEAHKI